MESIANKPSTRSLLNVVVTLDAVTEVEEVAGVLSLLTSIGLVVSTPV